MRESRLDDTRGYYYYCYLLFFVFYLLLYRVRFYTVPLGLIHDSDSDIRTVKVLELPRISFTELPEEMFLM